jgi:hypothetical protein
LRPLQSKRAVLTWLPLTQVLLATYSLSYFLSFLSNKVISLQTIPLTMAPKKRSKVDLSDLRALVQLEKEPVPLTNEDVKAMLIPSSYKSYKYTMALWTE